MPHTRSVGVSVALLIAVVAAIAFFWNVSRRAGHAPIAPPIARAEPLATPPIPESAGDPGSDSPSAAPAAAAAVAAPATSSTSGDDQAIDQPAPASEATPVPSALSPREETRIGHVISEGRPGLKACYERALVRDETLVRGNLKVSVAVAPSGHVRRVSVRGPAAFREKMTPCLETAVSNWRFPASAAAYEAQFPIALRGAE